ncbi:MAG: Crp/Fnr family transcriptional regulator [Aquihabitans sp.]
MADRRRSPLTVPIADPHVCSPNVRLQRLGQVPLFKDLDAAGLAEVDRHCRTYGFGAGEAIYVAGRPAARIFVVATGAAKSIRTAPDGRETILGLYGPGDFLGAVPALGEEVYADWAWSLTPSCLLGLDASDYNDLMEEIPALAMATLKGVSRRLLDSQHAVHLLAGAPLESRLAATLLLLMDKLGRPWEGATLVDVPLTRDDLASMTGAATESVSRLLSHWRRSGVIDSGRRWIAVRDVEALEAIRDA